MKRLIPCLTLKDRGLVKTVQFKRPRYVGDPINAVKIFNEKEVDELMVVDMFASKEKRQPDLEEIEDIVSEAFMPVSYGGGVSTLRQIEAILRVGVEKVSLNYFAQESTDFVKDAVREFGSSTIIGAMDIKRDLFGRRRVFRRNRRAKCAKLPVAYAKELQDAGVGELLVNSVDRDGTYAGYDIELIHEIASSVQIPVIACGGAGSTDDIRKVLLEGGAAAAAAGSIFVFYGSQKAVLINYPTQDAICKLLAATSMGSSPTQSPTASVHQT